MALEMETGLAILFLSVVVGGIIIGIVGLAFALRPYKFGLYRYLVRTMEAEQCRIVSARKPGRNQTAPFPPSPGAFAFRIVQFADRDGNLCQAWARLRFDGRRVVDVEWHPDFRITRGKANTTPDAIRRPADGSPKASA